jgi:uncharacterized UPF0146 family protein
LAAQVVVAAGRAVGAGVGGVAAVVARVARGAVDCVALAVKARVARRTRYGAHRHAWS